MWEDGRPRARARPRAPAGRRGARGCRPRCRRRCKPRITWTGSPPRSPLIQTSSPSCRLCPLPGLRILAYAPPISRPGPYRFTRSGRRPCMWRTRRSARASRAGCAPRAGRSGGTARRLPGAPGRRLHAGRPPPCGRRLPRAGTVRGAAQHRPACHLWRPVWRGGSRAPCRRRVGGAAAGRLLCSVLVPRGILPCGHVGDAEVPPPCRGAGRALPGRPGAPGPAPPRPAAPCRPRPSTGLPVRAGPCGGIRLRAAGPAPPGRGTPRAGPPRSP